MEKTKVLLFVDATLQQQKESRTYAICRSYLDRWQQVHPDCEVRHLVLNEEELAPLNHNAIVEREALVEAGDFSHEALRYAFEFARADYIVMGAPYWELSFPAVLKLYIERVSVTGITFEYTPNGARGLCRAPELLYITSAGGFFNRYDLGTEYIRGMCESLWGIPVFRTVAAQGLDIDGADVKEIMECACKEAEELACSHF